MSVSIAAANVVHWLILGLGVIGFLAGLVLVWFRRGEGGGGEGTFLGLSFKAASTAALVILLSALAIGWSARQLAPDDGAPSADAVVLGKVQAIEQLPSNPVVAPRDNRRDAVRAIVRWFAQFGEARIVVDLGSSHAIARGDWFATVSDPDRAKGLPKAAAGNLQDDLTALVRVITVYPHESVSKLEEWAYDAHLRKVGDIPISPGKQIDLEARGPVVVGQTVAAVPREEKLARDQVDRWFQRADKAPKTQQELLYEQAELRAADFLQSYPDGFFAGDVLWTKASSQFELGHFRLAIRSWEHFRDEFPFHPSARAVEEWILRASRRLDGAGS